jgi:uncharacterized protein (DUF2141 family)
MKTKLILFIIIFATAHCGFAQSSIEVTIKNIKGAKGTLRVGLFDDAEKFLKTPAKGQVIKITGETVSVRFENIADGTYAVSVIHDENENGELDSGFMGIPKEGFGFSNDAMGMFGPPKFKESSFVLPEKKSVSVTLKYM